MTTNQTIDGVPRACDALECLTESFRHALQRGIQPSFSMGDLEFFIKTFDELRALLDAPAVSETPFTYMRIDVDGNPYRCNAADHDDAFPVYRRPAAQPQGEPVAPWFYFVECDDPDYSGLFNHESEAQTQANDHGGVVVKLWNVPPTCRPATPSLAGFWQWLDTAYRDGSKGEETRFTKYNMEVAYSAGANAEQPAPVAVVLPERREPTQDNPYLSDADHEWNAYRDELKRLNPSL